MAYTDPDAMCIRFGYTDTEQEYGKDANPDVYGGGVRSSERGISFRVPVLKSDGQVEGLVETTHLGRDKSTIGCGLYAAHTNKDNIKSLLTVAPWEWQNWAEMGNKADLNKTRLSVIGNISAWKSSVHALNYTLSHHCETDEERDWDNFPPRNM